MAQRQPFGLQGLIDPSLLTLLSTAPLRQRPPGTDAQHPPQQPHAESLFSLGLPDVGGAGALLPSTLPGVPFLGPPPAVAAQAAAAAYLYQTEGVPRPVDAAALAALAHLPAGDAAALADVQRLQLWYLQLQHAHMQQAAALRHAAQAAGLVASVAAGHTPDERAGEPPPQPVPAGSKGRRKASGDGGDVGGAVNAAKPVSIAPLLPGSVPGVARTPHVSVSSDPLPTTVAPSLVLPPLALPSPSHGGREGPTAPGGYTAGLASSPRRTQQSQSQSANTAAAAAAAARQRRESSGRLDSIDMSDVPSVGSGSPRKSRRKTIPRSNIDKQALHRIRERNKSAAARSRLKKKTREEELKHRASESARRNAMLRAAVAKAEQDVQDLRRQLGERATRTTSSASSAAVVGTTSEAAETGVATAELHPASSGDRSSECT